MLNTNPMAALIVRPVVTILRGIFKITSFALASSAKAMRILVFRRQETITNLA